MSAPTENETWLIDTGDAIIRKKATQRPLWLTLPERLVYCVWVADYGMRNAGDLGSSKDLHAEFLEEGRKLAEELRLPYTHETFSLPEEDFKREYFQRFERLCDEIKNG